MNTKGFWTGIALVIVALLNVPALAQTPLGPNFTFSPEFFANIPVPPVPPLPPLPPAPFQNFHFDFGPFTAGHSVDPEVALRQEVFRSLLRTAPDRALDIAGERLKADPADPVVLANLSAIAHSNSSKALPLLVSVAKTSSNIDARRSAVSAISRMSGDKGNLAILEDLYKGSADSADMRRTIVQAIARVPTSDAVSLLVRIAKTDSDVSVRRAAARYLGNRNEPDVNKALEDLLIPGK